MPHTVVLREVFRQSDAHFVRLLNEMRVWLPYNLLAFKFVPVHVRPTTTMALTFCWHTYISATAAAATRGPDR